MISWEAPCFLAPNHPMLRWVIWINVTFISMMAVMSTAGDFLAAPTVQGALMLSRDELRLINVCFILMLGIMPPLSIWLAQNYGYKKLFFVASLIFIVGSLLNGMAFDFWSFLLSRSLSGAAAGAIFPLSIAIIEQNFPKKLLTAAVALNVGLSFGIGNIYGFWSAGFLTQYVSWGSFYSHCALLNLPVLLVTWLFHPETPPSTEKKGFDFSGYAMFILFIANLILILDGGKAEWNPGGWGSPFIITSSLLALIGLIAFIYIELNHPNPLIHFSLLKEKTCLLGCIYIFFVGAIFFATQILSVTFLDADLHYEKNTIGIFLIPRGFIFGLFAVIAALLAKRVGIRLLILLGMAFLTLSCWLNTSITIYSSHSQIQWMWICRMIGFGFTWGTAVAFALLKIPPHLAGAASVLIILSRQIGGTLGSLGAGNLSIQRTLFHDERFGAQMDVQGPVFKHIASQLQTHLSHNLGKVGSEAKSQALNLIRSNVQAQAHATSINDAFFFLGTILGVITVALILEALWELYIVKKRVDDRKNKKII
jgi:DHA2 family multidrug resistance protein